MTATPLRLRLFLDIGRRRRRRKDYFRGWLGGGLRLIFGKLFCVSRWRARLIEKYWRRFFFLFGPLGPRIDG